MDVNNQKPQRTRALRASLGFVLAPVFAALLLEIPALVGRDPNFLSYVIYLLEVGYAAMLVLGLPFYLLAIRFGWTRLSTFVFFGGILGLTAYVLIFESGIPLAAPGAMYAAMAKIRYLPLSMVYGILCLAFFWWLSRPDQP